ncbi:MAG TPA: DUF5615 family PIN-like protein [Acidimicrobiia bacterium]|nr:DUF5615 family PIN-like protein [Acidimicrobiia bacterium]
MIQIGVFGLGEAGSLIAADLVAVGAEVRVLLDAYVSGRVIGRELRKRGHDVLSMADSPALEGLAEIKILEMAATEGRILVTFDVKDFAPLLRMWAEEEWSHSGVIFVHGLDHKNFGRFLEMLNRLFEDRPHQQDWTNTSLLLARRTP